MTEKDLRSWDNHLLNFYCRQCCFNGLEFDSVQSLTRYYLFTLLLGQKIYYLFIISFYLNMSECFSQYKIGYTLLSSLFSNHYFYFIFIKQFYSYFICGFVSREI